MKPLPYVRIDKFLDEAMVDELYRYALDAEQRFEKSGVIGDASWRESRLVYSFAPWDDVIRQRIAVIAPAALEALGGPRCRLDAIETQMTVHGEGHYFHDHWDSGSPDTAGRVLSYVYYFCRSPKPFTGGELIVYEGVPPAAPVHVVEPRRNTLVMFLSTQWHAVKETHVASRAFSDGRFTANGWVRVAS
jgi:SM-20-related protein